MFDISYCKGSNTTCVVFNNIECIFRKSGINKYLTFCKYVKIIDEIEDQVLFIIDDENEDKKCIMGKDFNRFKFKTDDNLPYNKIISAAVCIISKSCVFEESNWCYPQIELQDCFYENSNYFVEN